MQPIVTPEDTSNKAVTYKIKDKRIATVDENGLLTAVKGGKTKLTVTTADGSKHSATINIHVVVPVTGVHYKHPGFRVGAGSHTYITAVLEPVDATNKEMTWVSSDESILTVKGNTNKVRVQGRKWGRTQITGTTADGGYTITLDANVGSLRHAVQVQSIEIRDGKPYIVLKNHSDMNITSVSYIIQGWNSQLEPIYMSTRGTTLYGSYDEPLAPGARTHHGHFNFHHRADYDDLQCVSIAITGWETDTGYYDNDNNLCYSYSIADKNLDWETYRTDLYMSVKGN